MDLQYPKSCGWKRYGNWLIASCLLRVTLIMQTVVWADVLVSMEETGGSAFALRSSIWYSSRPSLFVCLPAISVRFALTSESYAKVSGESGKSGWWGWSVLVMVTIEALSYMIVSNIVALKSS